MRLFVALDIDADIRRRIGDFREQMRAYAPDVRWVGPETFHITLQFLGETEKLDAIQQALQPVTAAPLRLAFRGTGFFPTARSPRVFWVGMQADENLQSLVDAVGETLHPLGFKREAGPFTPHLTLARAGSGRPRPVRGEHSSAGLRALAIKLETLPSPEFGTMTAREFCLYQSTLSPSGAKYTKLATYPLA
jgi:RNA 2',3'-cyclic 3'-phosphodiesterase